MANHINLNKSAVPKDVTIILDTNVWLYLFNPYSKNRYHYDKIWEQLLLNEQKIFFTPLIGAEYVNRFCRLAYEEYCESLGRRVSYKNDFRPTQRYQLAFSMAVGSLNEDILPNVDYLDTTESDFSEAVTKPDLEDLNDDIILNTALRTQSGIITHDRDFFKTNQKVNIYSFNQKK